MERQYSIWQKQFCHPKYWGIWVFISVLYILAWLPWWLQLRIGKALGKALYIFARSRRHIVKTNVQVCFPQLHPIEQVFLIKRIFEANGIGLIETAIAWFKPMSKYRNKVEFKGLEHLKKSQLEGKGAILAGAHFTMLDLAGALSSLFIDLNVTYRPLNNTLLNETMMQGRQKFCTNAIDKKNIRGFVKVLKSGGILWYAPDQDYGPKHAAFTTFFGVPCANITTLTWLAKTGKADVLPFSYFRNGSNNCWVITIHPPLDIPSGNPQRDARYYNAWLESVLTNCPEQYLWLHKRFKTQPTSLERPFY